MLILTIIDQGASSVSNFALAILVAHYSDAGEIGVFAILTTTYVIAQGLVRSLTSDCLLTRSETDDLVMGTFERAGYLAALVVSIVLALCLLVVSGLLSSEFTVPLMVFAASFPLMALQDFSRFIGISRHDPAYAIRLDVAWLVLFLVAYGGPSLRGPGVASLAVRCLERRRSAGRADHHPSHLARRGRQLLDFWVKSERAVGVRFAGQFMLVTSWTYFIVYLLGLRHHPERHRPLQAGPAVARSHHGHGRRRPAAAGGAGGQAVPGRHAQGDPLPPPGRRWAWPW